MFLGKWEAGALLEFVFNELLVESEIVQENTGCKMCLLGVHALSNTKPMKQPEDLRNLGKMLVAYFYWSRTGQLQVPSFNSQVLQFELDEPVEVLLDQDLVACGAPRHLVQGPSDVQRPPSTILLRSQPSTHQPSPCQNGLNHGCCFFFFF